MNYQKVEWTLDIANVIAGKQNIAAKVAYCSHTVRCLLSSGVDNRFSAAENTKREIMETVKKNPLLKCISCAPKTCEMKKEIIFEILY